MASKTTATLSASYGGQTQTASLVVAPGVELGASATVTVSSENPSTGQLGMKAVDGIVDGYPGDYTKEWATAGQLAGAWIRLGWRRVPVAISQVILHDRPNLADNILSATLTFSDGSSVSVPQLPNDGFGVSLSFAAKTVTWVKLTVNSAVGENIGLAEFEVYGPTSSSGVTGLTFDSQSITGGTSVVGTVTLSSFAPRNGALVLLTSTNPALVSVPATVTIPQGAMSATFTATTATVTTPASASVQATFGGNTVSVTLSVNPPGLSSVSVSPGNVAGGMPSQGTVTLSQAAAPGGSTVALQSDNSVAGVPGSVRINGGTTGASFPITTSVVSSLQTANIRATYNSATMSAPLTVAPLSPVSATISPNSVGGGSSTTGTVTLNGPADIGGTQVTLSSDQPGVAGVPAAVRVAAGSTSASFTITSSSVGVATVVNISASLGSVTQQASLTVNAANIAPLAAVTVSSQNTATGQLGIKAVDGTVDGYPGDYGREWATLDEIAGAWIRLTWSAPVNIAQVVLHDRPNLSDNILSAKLSFSDGSNVAVSQLPNDGTGLIVNFAARQVTWVQMTVNNAVGENIGLAEFEVYGPANAGNGLTL